MQIFLYTLVLPALIAIYVLAVRKSMPDRRRAICDALAIVAVCGALIPALIPPSQKIKLGRDLRGGVSMIYAVNMPEGVNKRDTLAQTIRVLKDRVNPQGVLDLSLTPQGDDRIEVVMPLPDPEVREAQVAYRAALEALVRQAHLTPRGLETALRESRAAALGGSDPARVELFTRLQGLYDAARQARERYEAAKAANASAQELAPLEEAVAASEVAFENVRAQVRTGALTMGRLERVLDLPATVRSVRGAPIPAGAKSERELALEELKAEFPAQAKAIDELVALRDAYTAKRKTLDDPEDLKRMLRGAGVLDFRIAVTPGSSIGINVEEMRQQLTEGGPNATDNPIARWFKINDMGQWAKTPEELALAQASPADFFARRGLIAGRGPDSSVYLLLFTDPGRSMTHGPETLPWSMRSVRQDRDQMGRPAVAFQLDTNGGTLMSRMTSANLQQPMAIVLDNHVYTAPNLNSRIADSGIIEGNFSPSELDYLVRVLASGSLGARLAPEPMAVSVLGPAMGKDNLERGMWSMIISVGITFAVMALYYFLPGFIANISLLVNGLLIFFSMSLVDANFTLPGLAGVALSLAMAVDANVLIYERLREELVEKGKHLIDAIETAMKRAATAIIDGNLTHLIVVLVLYWFAGTEVKGFALVMGIGVFSTLVAGLIVTHVLLLLYAYTTGARSVAMLPISVPVIARILRPNLDWVRVRHVLWGFAILLAVGSVIATVVRGNDIFETEFRGGTSMTMVTRSALPGEPQGRDGRLLLARPDVEARLHQLGRDNPNDPILSEFTNASVLTVGEQTDKFEATQFQIKVPNPADMADDAQAARQAVAAVVGVFESQMDIRRPVSFRGGEDASPAEHTYRIRSANLSEVLGRPDLDILVDQAMGGVVVLVQDINPPIAPQDVAERIRRLRAQPDFSDVGGRTVDVYGLTEAGDGKFSELAVVVGDPELLTGIRLSDAIWQRNYADREWALVSSALGKPATLEQVSSISPTVAREMTFYAALAVLMSFMGMLIYIWVRFGSLLYSVATVIGVVFNVAVCLGALAVSKWVGQTGAGAALLIQDFRIDLNVVAALLTVIGYSINDTIVILDRVRENRGKLPYATRSIVNDSINQTFSRTIMTGSCTALTPIVLYVMGGPSMQPFAYTFLVGLIAGTFSSVAIAAPLVYVPGKGLPEPAGGPATTPTKGPRAAAA